MEEINDTILRKQLIDELTEEIGEEETTKIVDCFYINDEKVTEDQILILIRLNELFYKIKLGEI